MFSCRVSHVFPLVGILFLGLPALPRSHRNLCLCGVTSESLIFFSLSYRLLLSSPHPLSWINSPIHWWFITSSLMVFLYIDWTRPIAKKTRAFIIHEVVCKNEVPVLTSCVLYCVNMSLFLVLLFTRRKTSSTMSKRRDRKEDANDALTRIAIVSNDKCKPKRCRQECKKFCPVVRMGTYVIRQCLSLSLSGRSWGIDQCHFYTIAYLFQCQLSGLITLQVYRLSRVEKIVPRHNPVFHSKK